ncbi:MAG: RDD family protein [Bacteroidetes bacterium]|nr:RDD family protein [Bacteroidota bacterium]
MEEPFEKSKDFQYRRHELVYDTFGRRFFALVIDCLVLVIPYSVLATVLGMPIFGIYNNAFPGFSWVIYYMARVVVAWLYFALLESSDRNGTIGKIAVDLKVVTLTEETASFDRASLRFFAKLFSAFILFVGFLMARWTDKKQTLHDLVCGTVVIYSGPEESIRM